MGFPAGRAWDGPPEGTGVPYGASAPLAPAPPGGASSRMPGEMRGREKERENVKFLIFSSLYFMLFNEIRFSINFYLSPSHNKKYWLHFP